MRRPPSLFSSREAITASSSMGLSEQVEYTILPPTASCSTPRMAILSCRLQRTQGSVHKRESCRSIYQRGRHPQRSDNYSHTVRNYHGAIVSATVVARDAQAEAHADEPNSHREQRAAIFLHSPMQLQAVARRPLLPHVNVLPHRPVSAEGQTQENQPKSKNKHASTAQLWL